MMGFTPAARAGLEEVRAPNIDPWSVSATAGIPRRVTSVKMVARARVGLGRLQTRRAVQQGVFGVDVEVREALLGQQIPLVPPGEGRPEAIATAPALPLHERITRM